MSRSRILAATLVLAAALLAGCRSAGNVVVLTAATAALGLLLSHRCLLIALSGSFTLPVDAGKAGHSQT